MPDISIKITNLPQIKAAFGRAPDLMAAELNKAIAKTVFRIKKSEFSQYKQLGIRVITSGLWTSLERGQYFSNLRGEVGANVTGSPGVNYALFVHSGTRFMKARPFLENAVDENAAPTENDFKDAVQNVLDKIGSQV